MEEGQPESRTAAAVDKRLVHARHGEDARSIVASRCFDDRKSPESREPSRDHPRDSSANSKIPERERTCEEMARGREDAAARAAIRGIPARGDGLPSPGPSPFRSQRASRMIN